MPVLTWTEPFAALPDPRVARTRRHPLPELLFIALCAVLCGADSFVEMEEWGLAREAWLRERLALPSGIPSHDTFARVFARLDPHAFHDCFLAWIAAFRLPPLSDLSLEGAPTVVALDGKQVRRSGDRAAHQKPIHLVSAWATEQRLVLAQVKVAEKSNEIPAFPELLRLLALEGCVVTIDAMGCQREVARTIQDQGGDYVLALKGNQSTLHTDVQLYLDDLAQGSFPEVAVQEHATFDGDHGRQERRRYWLTDAVGWLEERHGPGMWAGLRSIGMVECQRRNGGPGTPVSVERRYYLSSLPSDEAHDAETFARAVRGHWGIENGLHWVLDVAFREDECRVRKEHAPENLATLRHLALNLLRQERSSKVGVKARRMKAGWDLRYLEKVLAV